MIIRRYAGSRVPTEELSAEATLGFIKALETYDPERGPFSAVVRTQVIKYIDACAHRLGRSTSAAYGRQERALRIHGSRLYHRCVDVGLPSSVAIDIVAESMGYDTQHVAASLTTHQGADWSLDDGDRANILADGGAAAIETAASADRTRILDDLLSGLPADQAAVIRIRFLSSGGDQLTFGDVGAQLGMSEDSARRRHKAGMTALRAGMAERGLELADLI